MPCQSNFLTPKKRYILLTVGIFILILIIVASCVLGIYLKSQEETKSWKGNGTSKNMQEIVLGRCYDYLAKNPDLGERDCNKIWQELTNAVYKKDPCSITEDNYNNLIKLTQEAIPCNKLARPCRSLFYVIVP
ncbi:ADP-ribosyl cyclase cyclic ADP-ribose hydrolase 1 [Pelobates cultripes]|uniref:ADP-ribosyl cyclase/cyclic ADP-ribose hydrolase 1 n=1 Tax=Pelobates cultripes TaxID=61616 RepID=A0AAD1WDC1_PELCU|nr:ADP-ribosyl cyclase cyclic ADP-ribose hydrolase 1 [Pelobates cultripes]